MAPLHGQGWTTFYSAYQDGLEALRSGDQALAARAFRKAIALAPTPGTRVKTYGMNFLSAYHPYLKLAEASLGTGDLGAAEEALKQSAAWGLEPQDQRTALLSRLHTAQKASAPQVQAPVPQPVQEPVQKTPQEAPVAQPVLVKVPEAPVPSPLSGATPAGQGRPGKGQAAPASLPSAQAGSARQAAPTPLASPTAAPLPSPTNAPLAASTPPAPAARIDPQAVPAPAQPGWPKWAGLGGFAALLGGVWVAGRRLGQRKPPAALPAAATSPFPYATSGASRTPAPQGAGSSPDANLERAFGPWVAKRVLGAGGCGTAYYGVHQDTGAEVAIKVPHRHLLQNAEFVARFHREAAMGALLEHPGIVGILDPGPLEGDPWLIMPFINGVTLEDYLHQFSPLPIPQAIRLASDVAEAMGYAHTKGVVHRDLKPANIMVCPQGAVIMDLGIARILDSGKHTSVYLGTPTYSAPEAMQNPSVGPPADRYALGIIVFEMLAGVPPFQGDNAFKLLEAHCFEALPDLLVPRPLVPARLHRLIQRLCAKKPEERPEDGETIQILRELKAEFPCAQP